MPIMATPAPPQQPALTQEVVDLVMAEQKQKCAPSTWDRFVKSLRANHYPWSTDAPSLN